MFQPLLPGIAFWTGTSLDDTYKAARWTIVFSFLSSPLSFYIEVIDYGVGSLFYVLLPKKVTDYVVRVPLLYFQFGMFL